MAYLDYNGLSHFKDKNDALYGKASDVADLKSALYDNAYTTTLTQNDISQGYWNSGSITSSTTRICSKQIYRLRAGDLIRYTARTLQLGIWIYYDTDPTTAVNILPYTAGVSGTITISANCTMLIQLKKSDGGNLTPSDYDATVTLVQVLTGVDDLDPTLRSFYDDTIPPFGLENSNVIITDNLTTKKTFALSTPGSTLTFSDTNDYCYSYFAVAPGDIYLLHTRFMKKAYYALAVDDDLTIKARYMYNDTSGAHTSGYFMAVIPTGATKLYIQAAFTASGAANFPSYFKPIKYKTINSIQSGLQGAGINAYTKMALTFRHGGYSNGAPYSTTARALSNEKIRLGKGSVIYFTHPDDLAIDYAVVQFNPYTGAYLGISEFIAGPYVCPQDLMVILNPLGIAGATITSDELTALSDCFYLAYQPMNVNNSAMYRTADVPSYYYTDDYYPNIISTVRGHESDCGNKGDQFVFFTDYHQDTNRGMSPVLIQNIVRNTSFKNVFFGGDAITQFDTKADAMQEFQDFRDDFWFVPDEHWFPVLGNHELNDPGESSPTKRLSYAEAYAGMIKPKEMQITVLEDYLYYVDNKAQKIRYYFFGCTYQGKISTATLAAFYANLAEVPAGYYVGVISHIGFSAADTLYSEVTAITNALSAFNSHGTYTSDGTTYDYSGTSGIVMFVLAGHEHRDRSLQIDDSFYVIGTTCDTALGEYTRTRGTINEQAFDLVQIDQTNRTLYLTRVGAGSDRSFTF